MNQTDTPGKRLALLAGSELRRDDAVARHVAARLEDEGFTVRAAIEFTPELALDVAGSDLTLFVDATVTEATQLRRIVGGTSRPSQFTHSLTPEEVAGCARLLYGWRGEAWLCLIAVEDTAEGYGLSEAARANAERALELIGSEFRP